MQVLFQPRCKPVEGQPQSLTQCLKMTVLHNQFDATTFRLFGCCVSHDVVFEDLPGDSVADELEFDQVVYTFHDRLRIMKRITVRSI